MAVRFCPRIRFVPSRISPRLVSKTARRMQGGVPRVRRFFAWHLAAERRGGWHRADGKPVFEIRADAALDAMNLNATARRTDRLCVQLCGDRQNLTRKWRKSHRECGS